MLYVAIALAGFLLGTGLAITVVHFRNRPASEPVRDFIYISDDKLDMYFEQIPEKAREKWIHELKINAKLVSYSIKTSPNPIVTRGARLKAVMSEQRSQERIGTVESDKPLMSGVMNMKQGTYSTTDDDHFDVVLFTGETEDGLTIALGGTARHLIGHIGEDRHSNSGLRGVLRGLEKASIVEQGLLDKGDETARWMRADAWGSEVEEVWRVTDGPTQRLEFVAVRLADGREDPSQTNIAILGSPLYVALGN